MKQCAYCGRANPDDANRCLECGTTEFVPPGTSPQPSHLLFRLSIAVCVGIVVSVLATFVAWQNSRETPGLRFQQYRTQLQLRDIGRALTNYHGKFGTFPPSLEKLSEVAENAPSVKNGQLLDGWRRPFLYSTDGTNYSLVSYGRDGKPGGIGLDYDLTDRHRNPPGSGLTFHQFLRDAPSRGIVASCALCGVLSFFLSFVMVKAPNLTRGGLQEMAVKLGATVVGAVLVATLISALHIPSGH